MALSAVLAPAATQPSSLLEDSTLSERNSNCNSNSNSKSNSSPSSSPHQYPTDLGSPILEEGDETESEPPNEPVTPVSGRQSQDFHQLQNHDIPSHANHHEPLASDTIRPVTTPNSKPQLILNTSTPTPPRRAPTESSKPIATPATPAIPATPATAATPAVGDLDPAGGPLQRRSTRGSTSSFKRTMSSLFRRQNSDKVALASESPFNSTSDANLQDPPQRRGTVRRWSMNKSSNTTRSNTPPSPNSPLEMAREKQVKGMQDQASSTTSPSPDDMFTPTKKNRASTGFALRSRAVNFVSGGNHLSVDSARHPNSRRRASSADFSQQQPEQVNPENPLHMDRTFWGLPAESGTGVKARRMSLSLPDDFTVDIGDLESEFEYQHKFLGRRGKHIGKGATSKVTLMVRKGSPNELYAVKEFRGKSSRETHEEYDKKVKSEYTLAKSLQHPNIVETVRLCRDHGRWNHVMEYCSEGDMFTLVNKKYLKAEDRDKDRQCLFKQLIQGIHYLHSNGIAHRDIKLENLLITEDSKLKITDFGVSEVFSGIHPGLREAGGQCGINMGEVRLCSPGICGSEPYIAPEVLDKAGKYDPRALDIWGAGIVMVHLIFGGALWTRAQVNSNENNKFYAALARGWERWNAKHADAEATISELDYPKFMPFDVAVKPPALRRILLQMLNPNPAKRISSTDIMNNRWFKNIECCQLESDEAPTHTIDAANMQTLNRGKQRKVFCHNHLPQKDFGTHSLGKMPGSVGY